jgi:GNAT superfamily N-acetyltransferase
MVIRQWKPKPLVITAEDTIEQRRAGRYVCTATWGSIEAADKGLNKPVRVRDAHPLHDGKLSRVGWWGEQVVGHVGVLRVPVRLGAAVLEMAGIAGVCADPRARNQGIASALMRDSLKVSKEAGLCFSLLFGIPNFYHRFGFVPAWAKHTISVKAEDLPEGPCWRVRKARKVDLPKMLAYYNGLYGRMDGSAIRDPRLFLRGTRDVRLILTGPRTGDWAYAILRKVKWEEQEHLQLIEACGTGADWPAAVMREAARSARRANEASVIFRLPPMHPICRQMLFHNAAAKTEYYRNESAMAAVLDFVSLARAMAPEWSRLMRVAGARVPGDGLAVRFRGEYYRWWPGRGERPAERLPRMPRTLDIEFNDALARLVMGYGECDQIMGNYGMGAREAALAILRAIFPARQSGFSPVDHF